MKLSVLKGLAHDLANNLEWVLVGEKSLKATFPINTNTLEDKNSFDRHCFHFIRSRLPESFDFKRIKEVRVRVVKPLSAGISIYVKIKVDENKEVEYEHSSVQH